MSTRLEFEATTGLGLTAGKPASQPAETNATMAKLPPQTTGGTDTGSMTTPDGKTRSVARCMWQDHVAADFVKANELRKSGDLKGSFKTGFLAALKAIGAVVATVVGTIAAGVVFWKDAPKSWDRSKSVQVLDTDTLQGEPSVTDSRTQPGLPTVDEENVVPGDEGDDEASSVGSAAELLDTDKQHTPTPAAQRSRSPSVDQAEIVVSQAGVSGSAVATQAPDKKALKAAAKAKKAADEAVERATATSALLGEITKRDPSKLDIEQVKKQIAGSVGKMVKAYKEASKANAGKPNLDAHLGNVQATQIAKQVAAQLIGSANSADDVLALHKALKEVAEDKGGSEKFVQLERVRPGEHYPTTLADEVVRVVNEQGLMPALLTHMKRDVAANYDGTPESAFNVSEQAMKNLRIAARRGIFAPNQVDAVRQTIAYKFAAACEEALVQNLQTQDPKTAYAAFEASMNEAVRAGLLTEAEVQGIVENVQGNVDIQAVMVASAVRTIVAQPAADDEDLRAVAAAVAPGHLAEEDEFLSSVVQQVEAIRAAHAKERVNAVLVLQRAVRTFLEKRRVKHEKDARVLAEEFAKAKAAQELARVNEAARVHAEEQAQLLADFDAQMKPVEAAQQLLQENIDLLNGSLAREEELSGLLGQIANKSVRIPVVNIVQGVAQVTGEKSVPVTEAMGEVNALRALVYGEGILPAQRSVQWKTLMTQNEALAAASEAGKEYQARLNELDTLGEMIGRQRVAVWESLEALQKLITPYGEYHAANIGKLDADKQPAVNKRLEKVQTNMAAQAEIIYQIGVDKGAQQPVQVVPLASRARFADLFGDEIGDSSLFAERPRAGAVSVQLKPGQPLPGRALSPVPSVADRTRPNTPAPAVVLQASVVHPLADQSKRAQTPPAKLTAAVLEEHNQQQRVSRSLTASPVAVNQGLWTQKVAVILPEVAGVLGNDDLLSDDEESVGGDFHSVDGDRQPAKLVDGDRPLHSPSPAASGDESDDAGSYLNSRSVTPTGQLDDVPLPGDDK